MTNEDYINNVLKTESIDFEAIRSRMTDKNLRLLHAALGLATEAGEILDALKKHMFYGKPLDEVNLKEELGDTSWYQAIAIDALGTSLEDIQRVNIDKLKARYPDGFDNEKAINRNLDTEREILEEG